MKYLQLFLVTLLLLTVFTSESFAQTTTPSDSPTPSATVSPANSPVPSESTTPTAVPAQGSSSTNSPTPTKTEPTPTASAKKTAVLGGTDKLGKTGYEKDIAKWAFGFLAGMAIILYGLRVVKAHDKEE